VRVKLRQISYKLTREKCDQLAMDYGEYNCDKLATD